MGVAADRVPARAVGCAAIPVRAFRRAAEVVAGLRPAELAGRVQAGTLRQLPGIGDATAQVITQAVVGREPEYLTRLLGSGTPAPGRFKPGSAARSGEAACRTDLGGFRLISLNPARSADRASIAYARHASQAASFADAIVPAREARYDQALNEVLPDLEAWDFIFVRDEKNAIAGIVTTADGAGSGAAPAHPRTFTLEGVTSLCDLDGSRAIQTFDEPQHILMHQMPCLLVS